VQDKNSRDSLIKERNISQVIKRAKNADYILVGIGSSLPSRSGLVRAGYLREEELDHINKETGAVGDICCCLFDLEGHYKNEFFNDRVVGISLDQLKSAGAEVIGVAGGKEKAEAILGSLRGSLLDTLITDDKAAEEILKIDLDR
jgi:DNA-binding transcriptional regulator LsrR (DeoR family)